MVCKVTICFHSNLSTRYLWKLLKITCSLKWLEKVWKKFALNFIWVVILCNVVKIYVIGRCFAWHRYLQWVCIWCCCFIDEPCFFPSILLILLSMVTHLGGGHWQCCCLVHLFLFCHFLKLCIIILQVFEQFFHLVKKKVWPYGSVDDVEFNQKQNHLVWC